MALAGGSLIAALWTGLGRLGWNLPQPITSMPMGHGPLMVVGFLGTLISLERAVALDRLWAYSAPLFSAVSALALLLDLPLGIAASLAIVASVFLISQFIFLLRQQFSSALATMGLGALLWFGGNALWFAGYSLNRVVPWWVGFLVVTIAGERLELTRMLRLSDWDRAKFFLAIGLVLSGLLSSLIIFNHGIRLSAVGLIALSLWLLRYDMAWRTVCQRGLPRFMAICLLSGYVWLGMGGLLWLTFADSFTAGPRYDAMLHSIFLGFVFSMIFGHATVIFPSITGFPMRFQQVFYGHLALLHLSTLLRITADLGIWIPMQRWGGLLNVLTVLFFLINQVRAVWLGKLGEKQRQCLGNPPI